MSGATRWWGYDVAVVALYEVQQARRKRLLQALVLAYAAATGAAHWGFVQALAEVEGQVADTLHVARTERPGTLIQEVVASESMRRFLGDLVGDSTTLDRLLDTPVLALWAGAVGMVLLPVLAMAGTTASISAEIESRSIRYLALRTERLPIVLGKLLGQVGMLAAAALVGVLVTEAAGLTLMVRVPPLALLLGALEHTGRAWVYALPYAGLGLCASQWLGRTNVARVAGVLLLVGTTVAHPVLLWLSDTTLPGRFADLGRLFLPGTGWSDLWSSNPVDFSLGALRLVGVCLVWTAVGYLRFDRRDL